VESVEHLSHMRGPGAHGCTIKLRRQQ
jgi:hypothetical protein